ncbi:MAG: hypothetical protein NPINA01_06370 [Nitrospinaceae bacterium]|nr:MAG: hypothetical protein NPINA01_06370 [Nitrospinaceae bacterium]
MIKNSYALLIVAIPILTGYVIQVSRGRTSLLPIDAYLVFYAFSLVFALFVLGQKVHLGSINKNLHWNKQFDRVSDHALKIIFLLSAVYFLLWTSVLWGKLHSFRLDFIDSGIYSDIVYNSAYGQLFYSSLYNIHGLGEHFSPVVLAFVPFYWISPNVLWLLTAQVAAFALCPVILFFICREIFRNESLSRKVALGMAVLWFAFPTMLNAVQTGFHPSTLSPPFILLGFYFLVANRLRRFWAVMVLLLCFKENLALVWISFGLYSFLVLKRKTLGTALILIGGFWGIAVVKWVIPFFRGEGWGHVGRIGPTDHIYYKLKYLFLYLFVPLGFLSLANWQSSLMIWPPILLNLAVKYTKQLHGVYHYDDIIVPVLFLAAISALAAGKYRPLMRKIKVMNARYLMCWLLVPIGFSFFFPVERLIQYCPSATHRGIAEELKQVKERWPQKTIHVQHNLRMVLNRYGKTESLGRDWRGWKFEPGDLILLAPDLREIKSNKYYNLKKEYTNILKFFEDSSGNQFKRINEPFHFLQVYEVL